MASGAALFVDQIDRGYQDIGKRFVPGLFRIADIKNKEDDDKIDYVVKHKMAAVSILENMKEFLIGLNIKDFQGINQTLSRKAFIFV